MNLFTFRLRSIVVLGSVLSFAVFCSDLSPAFAQTVQILGIDPLKSASYECLRYGDPKLSQIQITSKNGTSKSVKKKKAKRTLKRSRKVAKKRLRSAKKRLKKLNKKISKLASTLFLSVEQQNRLQELKDKRTQVEARVVELEGNVGAISELIQRIPACFEVAPVNGQVEIVSGTYLRDNGKVYFYAGIITRWDNYSGNQEVCAQVTGNSVPVDNASGSYQLEAPAVSSFLPRYRMCYVRNLNEPSGCYIRLDGYASPMVGMAGEQAPGTCFYPETCSLSAALSILNKRLSEITFHVLPSCS